MWEQVKAGLTRLFSSLSKSKFGWLYRDYLKPLFLTALFLVAFYIFLLYVLSNEGEKIYSLCDIRYDSFLVTIIFWITGMYTLNWSLLKGREYDVGYTTLLKILSLFLGIILILVGSVTLAHLLEPFFNSLRLC